MTARERAKHTNTQVKTGSNCETGVVGPRGSEVVLVPNLPKGREVRQSERSKCVCQVHARCVHTHRPTE